MWHSKVMDSILGSGDCVCVSVCVSQYVGWYVNSNARGSILCVRLCVCVCAGLVSRKNGSHLCLFVPPWLTLTMNTVITGLCVGRSVCVCVCVCVCVSACGSVCGQFVPGQPVWQQQGAPQSRPV